MGVRHRGPSFVRHSCRYAVAQRALLEKRDTRAVIRFMSYFMKSVVVALSRTP
jgi:hypothetical protein